MFYIVLNVTGPKETMYGSTGIRSAFLRKLENSLTKNFQRNNLTIKVHKNFKHLIPEISIIIATIAPSKRKHWALFIINTINNSVITLSKSLIKI